MSVRISLTLEASEMFLSLHMIFSLERAAVVWAILERISGFDEVRMSIMASPAWTNSAGMLSTPADFLIFSALTTASTSSRTIG